MRKSCPWVLIGLLVLSAGIVEAQPREFQIRRARVMFTSDAPLETINGVSNQASGALQVDPTDLSTASGTVSVPIASLRTGIDLRDRHLRGEDWLDAARNPDATFELVRVERARALQPNQDARLRVVGRFTLHGVTREVRAMVRAKWDGAQRLRARARFSIKLDEFGVSINPAVRLKVSNDIRITIDLLATAG